MLLRRAGLTASAGLSCHSLAFTTGRVMFHTKETVINRLITHLFKNIICLTERIHELTKKSKKN